MLLHVFGTNYRSFSKMGFVSPIETPWEEPQKIKKYKQNLDKFSTSSSIFNLKKLLDRDYQEKTLCLRETH